MKRGKAPEYVPPPEGTDIQTRTNEPLEGTELSCRHSLGGYVKMLDTREGYVADDMKHLAFDLKPVWQRIAIVAAGPIANFLLAIAAYWLLFSVGVTGVVPEVGKVDPDSPAGRSGFSQGMEIVAVDGESTPSWLDVNMQLFSRIGDSGEIEFTVTPPGSSNAEVVRQIQITEWLPTRKLHSQQRNWACN